MADISTIQFDGDDTIYNIKDTKARNNLAASYSSSSTYQVGDIVIYNGELYKCITAVSTAEEWDETKWQQTTVGSAIGLIDDSIKEDATDIEALKEENENLKNALATVSGTGTNITLNKTSKNKFKKFEVGGNTEQTQYSGKNLFDESVLDEYKNDEDDEAWIFNNSALYNKNLTPNVKFKENTAYTIQYIAKQTTGNPRLIIVYTDGTTQPVGNDIIATSHTKYTQVSNSLKTIDYITSQYSATGTKSFYIKKNSFMVEEGTTATSYEPYCGGTASPNPQFPQAIKNVEGNVNVKIENKNLAWNGWAEDFVNRINDSRLASIVTKDGKRCLKFDRTAGYGNYDTKYLFKTNWKENTQYTLSCDLFVEGSGSFANIQIRYTDGTISDHRYDRTENNWEKYTLVSTENKTVTDITVCYLSGINYIDLDTFMVEQSPTATSYVEHQEQNLPFTLGNIELNKIDTAQDKFIKQNDKWYKHEGNEKGTIGTATDLRTYGNNLKYAVYSRILANKPGINTTDFPTIIADKARGGKTFTENTIYITDAGKSVVIFGSENDTLETFNQKFTGTNFKYILATPTDIEITDTTLKSQLEAIKETMSYYEQTNITSTSDEIGAIIDAEAIADMNSLLSGVIN